MIDWESWISKKGFSWAMTLAIVSGGIGVVVFIIAVIFWFNDGLIHNGAVDPNASGNFGSFIGGVVGIFIGLFTAGVTVAVLSYQIKELKATVQAQENSAAALKDQLNSIECQRQVNIIYDEIIIAEKSIDKINYIPYFVIQPIEYKGYVAILEFLKNLKLSYEVHQPGHLTDKGFTSAKIYAALLPFNMIIHMLDTSKVIDSKFKSLIAERILVQIPPEIVVSIYEVVKHYNKLENKNIPEIQNEMMGILQLYKVHQDLKKFISKV